MVIVVNKIRNMACNYNVFNNNKKNNELEVIKAKSKMNTKTVIGGSIESAGSN